MNYYEWKQKLDGKKEFDQNCKTDKKPKCVKTVNWSQTDFHSTISFIKCIKILRQAQLSGGEAEHTAVAPAACVLRYQPYECPDE